MIIKTSIPYEVEDWDGIDNFLEKYSTADPGKRWEYKYTNFYAH